MKDKLRLAFEAAAGGFSPDRVVADPELNRVFLAGCREHGLAGSDATLNRALLNLRKKGDLRGLKSKRSSFLNEGEYRFAAEIAARFIERRDGLTLDEILCDPLLAKEFDSLAASVSPGFTSAQYRWAALNLRKTTRLSPDLLSRVIGLQNAYNLRVSDLELGSVPLAPGLYMFFTVNTVLYVGEAENLQNRVRKHLDHSDNKGLARWLWEQGSEELHLELQVLPAKTSTRVRRAIEIELIRSRNPLFNIKR